jgi:hypothetical protein
MCLNELYKLPKGDQLFQDAPDMIANFLNSEQDVSAKRNALMFLTNHDPDRAVNYLSSQADKLIDWGAILQMAVLDLIRKVRKSVRVENLAYAFTINGLRQESNDIMALFVVEGIERLNSVLSFRAFMPGVLSVLPRYCSVRNCCKMRVNTTFFGLQHPTQSNKVGLVKVCRTRPSERGKYIKIILALLGSTKPAVVYDCATTLVALSQAPTAIRAAANCFCQLLVTHSDNNVKLIVLDRLHDLMKLHVDVLSEMLMDILRALAAPAFDIRQKILDLAMDLITPRNVGEVRGPCCGW